MILKRLLLPLLLLGITAGKNTVGEVAEEDRSAIENCLAIIRQCQMADGMIRIKGDGDPVWTVPYVSNFAAMALLAANNVRPNPQDVHRAERWLLWYAENQEPDGTINDRTGTVASYRSNGRRDSTDSYAATFLMAVRRYQQAIQGRPAPKIVRAARMALGAIAAVTQPDGLGVTDESSDRFAVAGGGPLDCIGHASDMSPALLMLVAHHACGTALARKTLGLHRREKVVFLLAVMAAVGEVSEEVQRLLRRGLIQSPFDRTVLGHLLQTIEHLLDNAVFTAKDFGGLHGRLLEKCLPVRSSESYVASQPRALIWIKVLQNAWGRSTHWRQLRSPWIFRGLAEREYQVTQVATMAQSVCERVENLLRQHEIAFQVLWHEPVYTSEEAARVRGTRLASGAKALVCKGEEGFVMFVLLADRKLDSHAVRRAKGWPKLRFAARDEVLELTGLAPGCIPPFGSLFGLLTFCDGRLGENDVINFNAGDHSISVGMRYAEYVQIEKPDLGIFAMESEP